MKNNRLDINPGMPARLLTLSLTLLLSCPPVHAVTKFEQLSQDAEAAYQKQDYPTAQKAFEDAIKESDKLEKDDKRIAMTNYNLALVFQAEHKYVDAEKYMLKALQLMSSFYGPEHQRTARVYMDLADLYIDQAEHEEKPELRKQAADNYKKGIELFEKIYAQSTAEGEGGADKTEPKGEKKGQTTKGQDAAGDLANALHILAESYAQDEAYDQAEPLYKRSIELEDFATGPDTKDMVKHKARLAEVYCVQSKYKLAEPYFKDALETSERLNGPDSPETAQILYNFGGMHYDQGEFADAEIKFKRAFKIMAAAPDKDELDIAQKNIALADALDMEGKIEEAQALYVKLEPTFEKAEDKGALVRFLKQFQKHYLMQNKKEEAAKIASRIKEIKNSASQSSAK